ncbi:MAG: hypothetical protein JWN67_4124 [Actinomycetia bacterium]|nr:hypothetical protein [Actinomycetes bacterium]
MLIDRRPREILAVWTGAVAAIWMLRPPPSSWHFFHDAAGMLVGDAPALLGHGGLHLWQSQPDFQFGPVTVLFALVLRVLAGSHDAWAARLVIAPLAPVLVWLVEDAATHVRLGPPARTTRRMALAAGVVLVPIWDYLALGSLHIDDAIAMTAAVLAVWAIARRHPLVVAIALGVAANAKPWAVVFLPLALATPAEDRRRTLGIAAALALLPWLPFLLAAPGTIQSLRAFRIHNMSTSALRALGIHTASTPSWDRPAQLGLGLVAGLVAVRRGRWPGALLVGVAIRLLLDPGSHLYYSAGLVVAALVWDLVGSPWTIPWVTLATAAALQVPRIMHAPPWLSGWLRLLVTVGAVVAVFACPTRALAGSAADDRRPAVGAAS